MHRCVRQDYSMELWQAPVDDVRPLLVEDRVELLDLLTAISADDWLRPTAAPGWTVKDIALHLLDDDLGWLSRGRDADLTSLLDMSDYEAFVASLAAKNQRWVDGAQGLSRRVVVDLLRWTGEQMDAYYAIIDLLDEGRVSWASDGSVPQWFDIAQDLTERWVHQLQIREAVDRVEGYRDKYLPSVLRTFVWALPHQYRVSAAGGAVVQIDLSAGGTWTLTCDGASRWHLNQGTADDASAHAWFSDDAGWRWLTGAAFPDDGVRADGPDQLVAPLLSVRSIIVERTQSVL
jgi:uncharacterized protein (TIGR03083 family)